MTATSSGSVCSREQVEQREQAVVAPAGVVVAEEDVDGRGRGVELRLDGIEPVHRSR